MKHRRSFTRAAKPAPKAAERSPAPAATQREAAPAAASMSLLPLPRAAGRIAAPPCACGGGCPRCTPAPGSSWEREAERAAGAVAPALASPSRQKRQGSLPQLPSRSTAGPIPAGGGTALPEAVRSPLEEAFGYDLSGLRMHDDAQSHTMARGLGAHAFAAGSHIGFARGQAGDSPHGRHLLAHETAHVVQSALDPAAPPVQRYEAAEHQKLGDEALAELATFLGTEEGKTWATEKGLDAASLIKQIDNDPLKAAGGKIQAGTRHIEGTNKSEKVSLTPGQIIALGGDFYKLPMDLKAAASAPATPSGPDGTPQSELDRINAAIKEEKKGNLADPNAAYEGITGGRFLKLARVNDTHFAPLNRKEWRRLHEQALAEARAAGSETDRNLAEEKLQSALLTDAFGGHFLTDAYAAGHLFKRDELMSAVNDHLALHPVVTPNPAMQTYAGMMTVAGNMPELLLKSIHDRMNSEGFEVTNGKKMKWKSFGDTKMANGPDTERIASLAVFLSRQQIYQAYKNPDAAPPDSAEIESYMPDDSTLERATQQAIGYIPSAAADVQNVMYRGRNLVPLKMPPVLGQIVQSNLSAIGAPGREGQEQRWNDMNQQFNMSPTPAPQFQVAQWDLEGLLTGRKR